MIERVIVLPTKDNDGKRLDWYINKVRAEVLAIAGGYSESRQTGVWCDPDTGMVYKDTSVRLATLVDAEQDARLAARIPAWCVWLRQVCLLTTRQEVAVAFVNPLTAVVGVAS